MFDISTKNWIEAAIMMIAVLLIIANILQYLANVEMKKNGVQREGLLNHTIATMGVTNDQLEREKFRLEVDADLQANGVRIKFLQRIEDFAEHTKELADAETDPQRREGLLMCQAYAEFLYTQADIDKHIELEYFQKCMYEKFNAFYTSYDRLSPALSQVERDELYAKSIDLHEQSVRNQEKTLDFQQKITEAYAVIAESLKTIAENKKG